MKNRVALIAATVIVILAVALPLGGMAAGALSQPQVVRSAPAEAGAAAPAQFEYPAIPDQRTLLNYPYEVSITVLEEPERSVALTMLQEQPGTLDLMAAMADKGFDFGALAPEDWEVMRVTVHPEMGDPATVTATTVSMISTIPCTDPAEDCPVSAALTVMVDGDPSTPDFYEAHHTNLDPNLADVPDPVIWVNGMQYFYITTLRWYPTPYAHIVPWHYWWYNSHHHPNWYYAHYFWYWRYWGWYIHDAWPFWYNWAYGWYYWRYWYYWSTYFPWADAPVPLPPSP
jgi:hypothetical protein